MEAKIPYKVSINGNKVIAARAIDRPGEKGQFLQFQGMKIRWKGWPKQENVYAMNFVKSIVSKPIQFAGKKTLKIIVVLFGILAFVNRNLFNRITNKIIEIGVNTIWHPLQNYKMNPLKYKRAVRELYRVMSIGIDRIQEEPIKDKMRKIRDILCMILEYDNYYLMILQDLAAEVNLEELKFDEEDKEAIRIRFPWNYRYESIIDYSDFDKGKYKIKAEQLKLLKEEKLMELKAYYEQKMAELQARFQAEKDNLINEMTANVHKFEARASQFQQDYQEFGTKLTEASKLLPEPTEVLPQQITGLPETPKVEPPTPIQEVAQQEVKVAMEKAEAVTEASQSENT